MSNRVAARVPGHVRPSPARLLVVGDTGLLPADAIETLGAALAVRPRLMRAPSGRDAARLMRSETFDLVLVLVAGTPAPGAIEAEIGQISRLARGGLIVVLSHQASVSLNLSVMGAGAHDALSLPQSAEMLAERLAALAERHGRGGLMARAGTGTGIADFSAGAGTMQVLGELIARIAPSRAPVFITGEPGTGKSTCAAALHAAGPMAGGPFVVVDCADPGVEGLEARLFGSERDAGAVLGADGGTLVLDEIGALETGLQSRLLDLLATGMVRRGGGGRAQQVDLRVLCTTRHDPMRMIAEKRLREDLFYRLHVLPIHLPPLRQRTLDVLALARHFLTRHASGPGRIFSGFSAEALAMLRGHDWPGNLVELDAVMAAVAQNSEGGQVSAALLAASGLGRSLPERPETGAEAPQRATILPMWRQEQRIIEEAIVRFEGNITLAAAALEISPSTIYRKRQGWAEIGREAGAA